jgi:peptidyl-prolyl cis-trans isomerase D
MDIYEMAVKDQDFGELAKKYSQGPSKETGGYLGTFEKKAMVKPFADKAFSMETGEISKPVRTMFGWHIIKLVNKFEASTKTLDQVSKTIIQTLESTEKQNMAYYQAGEAFDAVIDGDDFDQVALIAGKKIIKSDEFSIDGKGLDLGDNAGFARAAFELPEDDISDVKQFGDSYYLIKVVKKIEPVVLEFDFVKAIVLDELKAKFQKEQAKKDAKLYLAKAVEANAIEQSGKDNKLKIKTTKLFTRAGKIEDVGNSDEIVKAGFSLSKDNKIYPEIIETSFGYLIVGFNKRKIPEDSEISKNIEALKKQVLSKKQSQSYQAWMSQLRKQNKITYNSQLLK